MSRAAAISWRLSPSNCRRAGRSAPQRHLFEEIVYVLAGNGSTTIELADGRKHSFEWGPKSLFALPLNTKYQHFNGSGRERALLASTHDLPVVMNLFHNAKFIFDNDFDFSERVGADKYFGGEGDFTGVRPGSHLWETNFVPDMTDFELKPWEARGAGSSNIAFILADGTMHAHMSEIPTARYKKGHRHGAGMHVFAVNGSGYSLFWNEGEEEFHQVPWRHGVMYAPPHLMFHQHFNTAPLSRPLCGDRYRQPPLSFHHHAATGDPGRRSRYQGRRCADRICRSGCAYSCALAEGNRRRRRQIGHGEIYRRVGLSSAGLGADRVKRNKPAGHSSESREQPKLIIRKILVANHEA